MDHAIVETVISLARESVRDAQREKLTSFVGAYARHLPAELAAQAQPPEMLAFLMERLAFLEEDFSHVAKVFVGRPSGVVATNGADVIAIETRLPDCAFIVKTLREFVREEGLQISLPIHGLVGVVQRAGKVTEVSENAAEGEPFSHVYLHVTAVPEDRWERMREVLEYRLNTLLVVNRDYKATLENLESACQALSPHAAGSNGAVDDASESLELAHWLRGGNFVFLGYAYYDASAPNEAKNSLGLLSVTEEAELRETIDSIAGSRIPRAELFSFYRTDVLSVVKSRSQLRYVGFKHLDADGVCKGEYVFVGLLASSGLRAPNKRVPVISRRVAEVLESFNYRRRSYASKRMRAILDSIPLEDLFYMTAAEIRETAAFIESAEEVSTATRVRIRRREGNRRVSICCVIARERFSEALRDRVSDVICQGLSVAHLRSYALSSDEEGPVRLHFYGSPDRSKFSEQDLTDLELTVQRALLTWDERLRAMLFERFPSHTDGTATSKYLALSTLSAPDLWRKYQGGFPPRYQESHTPSQAIEDISSFEKVLTEGSTQVKMLRVDGSTNGTRHTHSVLRLISLQDLDLNTVVPILEHMSLRTRARASDRLTLADGTSLFLMGFEVDGLDGEPITDEREMDRLGRVVDRVLVGRLHNDLLLTLAQSGLDAEQLNLLIGYRNCFVQMFSAYTRASVTDALLRHPECAQLWAQYFHTRFSPDVDATAEVRREELLPPIARDYADKVDAVSIIQDDIILRLLFSLVENTLRTNLYVHGRGEVVSFKIDSKRLDHIARPRPLYEIYVHGPHVEGVHLRGGMVARGGIRHSDRPHDYRTEIHGLMKTQMTKNVIIVPVGSKGGFITRRVHEDRDSMEAERKAQYENFMGGLLDLTDNIVGEQIVPPDGVLRHDGDDPYFVVAADKGTAALSDTANAVSHRYGFWLDDAFASGGSDGYDHKVMGITARGAWVCVERHFREMDVDIRETPITVVGIGDMAGDVFGNGMLLNDKMELIAAFDHRHVFVDPNPDASVAFAERKRIFELPRSSWMDYDQSLISEGGGVYDRHAKVIGLSEAAQEALGTQTPTMNGPELMQLILRAEVDLLWLGGIGTYVKHSRELHIEAGDKANDAIRIDAPELRAKVLGEGANLGLTALARTEYSLAGGRCNTDAVDNSAGVDCSDHEVNMKILMVHLIQEGIVADREARNVILRENEVEVGLQCERDNHRQSALLSLETRKSLYNVEQYVAVLHYLEQHAGLHRPSEYLPTDDEMREWFATGHAVPRNVLAVLVAYTKNDIYPRLLASDLPDMAFFEHCLSDYFPSKVVEKFGEHLGGHRLRREIVATVLTNELVNAAGCTFVIALANESRVDVPELALRHYLCSSLLGGAAVREAVHALDRQVPAEMQYEALAALEETLLELVRWWCWNEATWSLKPKDLAKIQPQFDAVLNGLFDALGPDERAAVEAEAARLEAAGFGAELAETVARLPLARYAFLVLSTERHSGEDAEEIARFFYETGEALHLSQLEAMLDAQPLLNNWDARFQSILKREIAALRREFISKILANGKRNRLRRFLKKYDSHVAAIGESIQVISKSTGSAHVPIFIVLDDYRALLN